MSEDDPNAALERLRAARESLASFDAGPAVLRLGVTAEPIFRAAGVAEEAEASARMASTALNGILGTLRDQPELRASLVGDRRMHRLLRGPQDAGSGKDIFSKAQACDSKTI